MKYFVVMPDGQKFGPASLALLNQWIKELRLRPDNLLEDELGVTTLASELQGLEFPVNMPESAIPSNYPRAKETIQTNKSAQQDAYRSLVFGVLSIATCFGFYMCTILAGYGIYAGWRSMKGQNRLGIVGFGLNIINFAFGVLSVVLTVTGWTAPR